MILTAPPSHREQKREKRRKKELLAKYKPTKPKSQAVQKKLRKQHFENLLKKNWNKHAKVFHECYRPYV